MRWFRNFNVQGARLGALKFAAACKASSPNRTALPAANTLLGVFGCPASVTFFLREHCDAVIRDDSIEPELSQIVPGDLRDTNSDVHDWHVTNECHVFFDKAFLALHATWAQTLTLSTCLGKACGRIFGDADDARLPGIPISVAPDLGAAGTHLETDAVSLLDPECARPWLERAQLLAACKFVSQPPASQQVCRRLCDSDRDSTLSAGLTGRLETTLDDKG